METIWTNSSRRFSFQDDLKRTFVVERYYEHAFSFEVFYDVTSLLVGCSYWSGAEEWN